MRGVLTIIAALLLCFAVFVALANFYLTFLRYPLHRLRRRPPGELQFVSVIPIVGTLAAYLATVLDSRPGFVRVALISLFVDTGGLLWAAVCLPIAILLDRTKSGCVIPRHLIAAQPLPAGQSHVVRGAYSCTVI